MKPIDVAIGIVFRESKVLIARRKPDGILAGYWEFPGGKRHHDETIEQCLERELWEELAIRAKPVVSFSPITHNYPHGLVCLHPFLCTYQSGDPRTIGCVDLKWIEPPLLRQYRFPEANGPLIEQIIQSFPPNRASSPASANSVSACANI